MPPAAVPQPNIGLIHIFFGIEYAVVEVAQAFRQTAQAFREEASTIGEAVHRAEVQISSADRATSPGMGIAPALGEVPVRARRKAVGKASVPDALNPTLLPDALREVWDHLEGKVATAKEMAIAFGLGPAGDVAIVQRVYALRKRGFRIETRRGAGYYRPDAAPRT